MQRTSFECYQSGNDYLDQGKYDEAIAEFTQAVQVTNPEFNPVLADAHYKLAIIYCKQDKEDLAEIAFKTALEINPASPERFHFAYRLQSSHYPSYTFDCAVPLTTEASIHGLMKFIERHPKISSLQLFRRTVGDAGSKYIIKHNSTLSHIDFSANNITDKGIKNIALHNKHIKTLNLQGNNISDKGIKSFCEHNIVTTWLSLNAEFDIRPNAPCNKIGSEGAIALASDLTLEELTVRLKEEDRKFFNEPDPLKRCNMAREIGIKTKVPSLAKLTTFFIRENMHKNPDIKEQMDELDDNHLIKIEVNKNPLIKCTFLEPQEEPEQDPGCRMS